MMPGSFWIVTQFCLISVLRMVRILENTTSKYESRATPCLRYNSCLVGMIRNTQRRCPAHGMVNATLGQHRCVHVGHQLFIISCLPEHIPVPRSAATIPSAGERTGVGEQPRPGAIHRRPRKCVHYLAAVIPGKGAWASCIEAFLRVRETSQQSRPGKAQSEQRSRRISAVGRPATLL